MFPPHIITIPAIYIHRGISFFLPISCPLGAKIMSLHTVQENYKSFFYCCSYLQLANCKRDQAKMTMLVIVHGFKHFPCALKRQTNLWIEITTRTLYTFEELSAKSTPNVDSCKMLMTYRSMRAQLR